VLDTRSRESPWDEAHTRRRLVASEHPVVA